jgi:hypothetical protein
VPGAHDMHEDLPGVGWYVPAAQGAQLEHPEMPQ